MIRLTEKTNENGWMKPDGMNELMYRVLKARGISSDAEARAFLHPDWNDLNDPYLLNDMDAAVAEIRAAIREDRPIVVYGDYDVDGVCASVTLVKHLRLLGADVQVYLPSRTEEGYGLNENAVRRLAAGGCSLLVTVDCGITSVNEIRLAKELGMRAVVTDHHTPDDILPDCPVVNPLLNGYPFPYLCGAGVAFKLVSALSGLEAAKAYVPYTALATIADIVSLTRENRVIAYHGLRALNMSTDPGLLALRRAARLEGIPIDSGRVGFGLAPRINACGRMGSAMDAWNMLMTDDPVEAEALAQRAEDQNNLRKAETARVLDGIRPQIERYSFAEHRAIVVSGDRCPSGVAGLVASKLSETYYMPSVVFSEKDGLLTGSCRSIAGINIHDALASCRSLLVRFGGHSQAAGVTLEKDKLPAFIEQLDRYLFETAPVETYIPEAEYDAELTLDKLTIDAVETMAAFEPTGRDNPAPRIRVRVKPAYARAIGQDGSTLKFFGDADGISLEMIWFGHGHLSSRMPEEADFVIEPQINRYQGRVTVQGSVAAMKEHKQILPEDRCFLTDVLYNYDGSVQTAGRDEVRALFAKHVYGTLFVCPTSQAVLEASALLEGLPFDAAPEGADLYPYNAVALRPDAAVVLKYHNIVLFSGAEGLTGEIPDRDKLRALLVETRRMLSAGGMKLNDAASRIAPAAGSEKTARAVIALFEQVGLIRVAGDTVALPSDPPRKVALEDSGVYRALEYTRNINQTIKEAGACRRIFIMQR